MLAAPSGVLAALARDGRATHSARRASSLRWERSVNPSGAEAPHDPIAVSEDSTDQLHSSGRLPSTSGRRRFAAARVSAPIAVHVRPPQLGDAVASYGALDELVRRLEPGHLLARLVSDDPRGFSVLLDRRVVDRRWGGVAPALVCGQQKNQRGERSASGAGRHVGCDAPHPVRVSPFSLAFGGGPR